MIFCDVNFWANGFLIFTGADMQLGFYVLAYLFNVKTFNLGLGAFYYNSISGLRYVDARFAELYISSWGIFFSV